MTDLESGPCGDASPPGVPHERPVSAATWVQHQVTGTAPPGTAEMYVQIGMETEAGHATGSVLYVDDVVWRATSGWMRMLAGSFLQLTPV
ncbi:hypothetical protein [Spongiactinospora gelatinilytica]|uniref:hypothetical protein n=1 Tax=Spongiactinospora gelatinilytica TaxID=2666298 RepID=UPI0011B940D1|nr:hypothetical protein [Spongiactinospora gelatinilytica]